MILGLQAGCAPAAPEELQVVQVTQPCGMQLVRRGRLPRPGVPHMPVNSGDPIAACELPAAADIEVACEGKEGVPIPGSRSPDDPDRPDFAFPDYTVTGAQCRFAEGDRSRALCTFELAAEGGPPRPLRAELVYRFRDLSNAVAHDDWLTHWEVDAVCRPADSSIP